MILGLTEITKGTALTISKMKGTRKICSQMFPFQERMDKNTSQLHQVPWKRAKDSTQHFPESSCKGVAMVFRDYFSKCNRALSILC